MLVIRRKQLDPHLILLSKFHSGRMIEANKKDKMKGKKIKHEIKWDIYWICGKIITSFKTREKHDG